MFDTYGINDIDPEGRLRAAPGPLKHRPGATVGRDKQVVQLWDLLDADAHLHIVGPRRTGKSQLVVELAHRAPDNWVQVRVDLSAAHTVDAAVSSIVSELLDKMDRFVRAKETLQSLLGRVVEAGPLTLAPAAKDTPSEALSVAFTAVDEALGDTPERPRRLLLVIDEVADAVIDIAAASSPAEAQRLLQVLREARQRDSRIRQVLLGSVGLQGALGRIGLPTNTINDLTTVNVGPLGEPEARELGMRLLAGTMADGTTWDDTTLAALWSCAGGFAILTELTIDQLAQHVSERHVTGEIVETIYRQQVLMGGRVNEYFEHFVQRIPQSYPGQHEAVYALLDSAARQGRINLREAVETTEIGDVASVTALLNHLATDGYLTRIDEHLWQWAHAPLAEVWRLARPSLPGRSQAPDNPTDVTDPEDSRS